MNMLEANQGKHHQIDVVYIPPMTFFILIGYFLYLTALFEGLHHVLRPPDNMSLQQQPAAESSSALVTQRNRNDDNFRQT